MASMLILGVAVVTCSLVALFPRAETPVAASGVVWLGLILLVA